ncbi:MAG: hypothetical protein AAGA92_12560 [Planctomycetota bacterium]
MNDSKRQYFCIDPTGSDIKNYALGRNIGSRALSYLLLQNNTYYTGVEPHPLVGSWIGDRFFVTGDDYHPGFEALMAEYGNIGQAIIEMIVDIEPYDLITYGGVDWLIRLMEDNGRHVTINDELRRRLLKYFRHQNHLGTSEELQRVISALRPSE